VVRSTQTMQRTEDKDSSEVKHTVIKTLEAQTRMLTLSVPKYRVLSLVLSS
jgi:hypothetical protein